MRLAKIQEIVVTAAAAGSFPQRIESFVSQALLLASNGLTLAELGQLLTLFVYMAVDAAGELTHLTGAQKKDEVLAAVSYLYGFIAPAIPLPWFLAPFRSWLREPVRKIVLAIADGIIEAAVAFLPNPSDPEPVALPAST